MIHAVGTALGEIIQNLRRTVRLTLYENRSRRSGMLLGRWWDLLSPLLQILIYWFVFSVGLGTQEKNGFPYHLWLMCGMMPWLEDQPRPSSRPRPSSATCAFRSPSSR